MYIRCTVNFCFLYSSKVLKHIITLIMICGYVCINTDIGNTKSRMATKYDLCGKNIILPVKRLYISYMRDRWIMLLCLY